MDASRIQGGLPPAEADGNFCPTRQAARRRVSSLAMARLRDVPHVLRTVGPVAFARRVWNQGSEDELMTWAAALAYSWLFAAFPFLIFMLTFVPNLPDRQMKRVRHEVRDLVYQLPASAADPLWSNVESQVLNPPAGRGWLRYLGLALALWSASGGMASTITALERCYELRGGRSYLRQRLVAGIMTFAIAGMILLVVLLLPVAGTIKWWIIRHDWYGLGRNSPLMIAFDIVRWALATLTMISILTVLYHWGPYVHHRFHWLTPGAAFTILVWVGLGVAFKVYFGRFASFNKTYGTVGGVAALLLVFYLDAAVLLFGAEINSEIDFEVLKIPRGTRNFIPAEAEVAGEFVGPLPTTPPIGTADAPAAGALVAPTRPAEPSV
jgi:membrane protein